VRTVVLVVEDDEDIRGLVEQVLREEGHTVMCAADGVEALNILKQIVPGLILLDNSMPRMDGKGLRSAIQSQRKLARVPIVSISASGDPSPGPGLQKPFGIEDLLGMVRRYTSDR